MADYIDRKALLNRLSESLDEARSVPSQAHWKTGLLRAMFLLQLVPSEDVVEVVRCKDCKHCDKAWGWCNRICEIEDGTGTLLLVEPTDYCKWGEKE